MTKLLENGLWSTTRNGKWYLEGKFNDASVKAYANSNKLNNKLYTSILDENVRYKALVKKGGNDVYFIDDFIPQFIPFDGTPVKAIFYELSLENSERALLRIIVDEQETTLYFPVSFFQNSLKLLRQKSHFMLELIIKESTIKVKNIDFGIPANLSNATLINPQFVSKVDKTFFEGHVQLDNGGLKIPTRVYPQLLKKMGLQSIDSNASLMVQGEYNTKGGFYYVSKVTFNQPNAPFQVEIISVIENISNKDQMIFTYKIAPGIYTQQSFSKKFTNLISLNLKKTIVAQIGKKNKYYRFPIERFLLHEKKVQRIATLVNIDEVNGKSKLWFNVAYEDSCNFLVSIFLTTLNKDAIEFSFEIGESLSLPTQFDGRYLKVAKLMPDEYKGVIRYVKEDNKQDTEYWLFSTDNLSFPVKILKYDLFLQGFLSFEKGAQMEVEIKQRSDNNYSDTNYWYIHRFLIDPMDQVNIDCHQSISLCVLWNWSEFSSDCPHTLSVPYFHPYFYNKPVFLSFSCANSFSIVVVLSTHLLKFKRVKYLNQGESLVCRLQKDIVQLSTEQFTSVLTVTELIKIPKQPKQNTSILEAWIKCEAIETKVKKDKERKVFKFVTSKDDAGNNFQIEPFVDWKDILMGFDDPMGYEYLVRMKTNRKFTSIKSIIEARKLE